MMPWKRPKSWGINRRKIKNFKNIMRLVTAQQYRPESKEIVILVSSPAAFAAALSW
jgi:hypothetical protein